MDSTNRTADLSQNEKMLLKRLVNCSPYTQFMCVSTITHGTIIIYGPSLLVPLENINQFLLSQTIQQLIDRHFLENGNNPNSFALTEQGLDYGNRLS